MSHVIEPIVFESLEPIEVPVKIEGKDYILLEASSTVGILYKDRQMQCTQLSDEGNVVKIQGLGALEPYLVSLCLFRIDPEKGRVPVSMETIKSWPNKVQKKLYKVAREIGELVEADDDIAELEKKLAKLRLKVKAAKNEPSGTTDGSESPAT